jgi:hypothetical protein
VCRVAFREKQEQKPKPLHAGNARPRLRARSARDKAGRNAPGSCQCGLGLALGPADSAAMTDQRRFPPPWRAEPIPGGYAVRDANGQALAYLYSRDNPTEALQAKMLMNFVE